MRAVSVLVVLAVLSLACASVQASAGNEDARYRACLGRCVHNSCRQVGGRVEFAEHSPASWELVLTGWSCDDDCRYRCATENRELRSRNGEPAVQYHGKWGFDRVAGVQELFSCLFSVLNAVPHALYLPQLSQYRRIADFGVHWFSFALVGMNTWFWSAVFHARDTPFTEKMDYFSAYFLIVWGLWIAVVRTLHMQRRNALQAAVLLALLAFYAVHTSYLTFVRFDYGYNMLVNTLTAVLSSLFWLVWLWRHRSRKYVSLLFWSIVGVYPMAMLELLDFSPFFNLIDAHALWHLSTVPFCFLMYAGVVADLQHSVEHPDDDSKSA